MKTLFHNPATLYRLTDDFYGFKMNPKPVVLSILKKSNDTAREIFSALENAGFELAHETKEEFNGEGVYIKEPLFKISEDKEEEYFSILESIDRINLTAFYA
jgi:hypothetical protein